MDRKLDSEKTFLILTDVDAHPILDAYRIMNAVIQPLDSPYDSSLYGTLICLSSSEESFRLLSKTSLRFFGILIGDEYKIRIKKDYDPAAKLENGYIGVPTFHEPMECPEGYWRVTYPHITIVPPSHKIHLSSLHLVEYFCGELVATENTYVHHVLLGDKPHHITRAVRNGKKPVIAGHEVVPGSHYTEGSGHSVIM
jgi:hypothetical protein